MFVSGYIKNHGSDFKSDFRFGKFGLFSIRSDTNIIQFYGNITAEHRVKHFRCFIVLQVVGVIFGLVNGHFFLKCYKLPELGRVVSCLS